MEARQVFLVVFPLFEAACYLHIHWRRNELLIRKRNKSAIYVASLAGWLAYFSLVVSVFGGVPCGLFYAASLLVAPLSVGPQVIRALTLRGKVEYSQLIIEDEISSRVQRKQNGGHGAPRLSTIRSDLSHGEAGEQSLPALVAASERKVEAKEILDRTNRIVKRTIVALIAVPALLLIVSLALMAPSQLLATDLGQCQPGPEQFQQMSVTLGSMSAVMAVVATVLVKRIDDELNIGSEIRRTSIYLGISYIVVLLASMLGHYEWQPLMLTVQQMLLSVSVKIIPFLPGSSTVNGWARRPWKRVDPASKSAVPGYGRPLPKASASARTSMTNIGRRHSSQEGQAIAVSWDAGLCILLSTEEGIQSFGSHCAREFR